MVTSIITFLAINWLLGTYFMSAELIREMKATNEEWGYEGSIWIEVTAIILAMLFVWWFVMVIKWVERKEE
jgi:uncharacterized protein YacL